MKYYVVDAFTDTVFKGNPAAVCVLDAWLSEKLMQDITKENNLSETAFTVKRDDGEYDLRWFTPGGEIDLCGHATLATAYILLHFLSQEKDEITFHTKSGPLSVSKKGDIYEMDMPAYKLSQVPVTTEMEKAIGHRPLEAWMGRDLRCVMENEQQVTHTTPDEEKVKKLGGLLLQLTARGTKYDCVTRSFAPKLGVWEDPVCGSGHCHIVPFWTKKLRKKELLAFQASQRTGVLYCRMEGNRVLLAGKAALYSIAEFFLPDSIA